MLYCGQDLLSIVRSDNTPLMDTRNMELFLSIRNLQVQVHYVIDGTKGISQTSASFATYVFLEEPNASS